ncbi:MAG: Asp-tRNA(Asn)/Glu-tRNA(Gln) amidotransferase subunit GatB [Pirellulales bacterium]|nr:Asp-tRNA(Asn)/Glu-tRNA(Gln) amidotransferase subunit GatB [Pirellulales bacterium]
MTEPYTIIIGLEVHVQLSTASKLFCGCSTAFGSPANTQTCPVCIGMPGSLPVMNREAMALALKTAVALNCEIPRRTKWDRKQYYYPDLPKGYQISQFDLPLSEKGYLTISDSRGRFEPKPIRIIRAHLEEDAGKSMHDEVAGKGDSRIDLNRTGTPLLEVVSEPDLRSPVEARAYLDELKLLLNYLDVSDCNMQEGSLRVDANINLHIDTPEGPVATPIVEVKNMNSFRAVERALDFEAQRQYEVWQETGTIMGAPGGHKTTRGWDETAQVTVPQRTKEESSDYRYFPDPDLVPVTTTEEQVEAIRAGLGELPAALRERLQKTYNVTPYDADVLVNQGRELVDYFTELADRCGDGKMAANWVEQDVLRWLNDRQIGIGEFSVSADALAGLLEKIKGGDLTTSRGRDVLTAMLDSGQSVDAAMRKLGIQSVDQNELETLCGELLAANPKVVEDVKEGRLKAVGALIGQAKSRNPNVNPGQVRELCLKLIERM